MANLTPELIADERASYTNEARQQYSTFFLEVPRMVQNDVLVYVFDRLDAEENGMPPVSVDIFTHDGGLTNGADDNWAVNNGDTIIYEVSVPDTDDSNAIAALQQKGAKGTVWTKYTHVLSGVTDGAVTKTELAASLNADSTLYEYAFAAADITAERVTLYPRGNLGGIRVVGGTANSVLLFSGSTVLNSDRTYTFKPVVAADWSWTFDRGEKTLKVTRVNASAAVSVAVRVRMF